MGRRFKSTSYGQKGGEGPTRGQTATTYLVTLPDGTVAKKKSFKVHSDTAWAGVYFHADKWHVAGVREDRAVVASWGGQQPVQAFREGFEKPAVSCPWCGSTKAPVATDIQVAEFVHSRPDAAAVRRNPYMCVDCHGVGGAEDFGL